MILKPTPEKSERAHIGQGMTVRFSIGSHESSPNSSLQFLLVYLPSCLGQETAKGHFRSSS